VINWCTGTKNLSETLDEKQQQKQVESIINSLPVFSFPFGQGTCLHVPSSNYFHQVFSNTQANTLTYMIKMFLIR
jgi:hypothetical protein